MSLNSPSKRIFAALPLGAIAIAFALTACTRVTLVVIDGGADTSTGAGGGLAGEGGAGGAGGDTGVGGDTGAGGDGAGGSAAGGSGAGGTGAGGTGAGGTGSGGAAGTGAGGTIVVDAGANGGTGGAGIGGAGGSDVDAGVVITPRVAGQLVITEIMANTDVSQDEVGEWFEVYNPSASDTYDLFSCMLFDSSSSNQDTIINHILVEPGKFVTLARFGDLSGGFLPSYNYHTNLASTTDVKFGNAGDRVVLNCSGVPIDVVSFLTWGVIAGKSFSLDPTHFNAVDNDTPGNWCLGGPPAYHTLGTSNDFGTPGAMNPTCTCAVPTCL